MKTYELTRQQNGRYETSFTTTTDYDVMQMDIPSGGDVCVYAQISGTEKRVRVERTTKTVATGQIWELSIPSGILISVNTNFSGAVYVKEGEV